MERLINIVLKGMAVVVIFLMVVLFSMSIIGVIGWIVNEGFVSTFRHIGNFMFSFTASLIAFIMIGCMLEDENQ
jgi:hypothetical protein